jgi:hypothetical protein
MLILIRDLIKMSKTGNPTYISFIQQLLNSIFIEKNDLEDLKRTSSSITNLLKTGFRYFFYLHFIIY